MNLAARKIELIKWILNLYDEKTLSRIEKIKNEEPDWWDIISDEEKEEIKKGLAQLDRGDQYPMKG